MAVWRYVSTHSYPRTRAGQCVREERTLGTLCTGPGVYLANAFAEVRSLCWLRLRYYPIPCLLTDARLHHRRWLQLHSASQSVPACRLQLNHVPTAPSLEFTLFISHFNCLICNCASAVKSDEEERLPGVSWRRAFNSSFDVWPLLLLSTSETPESAGLGGREPVTREHI